MPGQRARVLVLMGPSFPFLGISERLTNKTQKEKEQKGSPKALKEGCGVSLVIIAVLLGIMEAYIDNGPSSRVKWLM